jgi:cold shock CspA family protein
MQNHDKKVGVIRSWHENRGFGIVRIGGPESLEKYFLHVSQIRSGTAMPETGMTVRFNISSKPVKDGQLPQAIDADIEVPSIQPSSALPDGGVN